MMVADADLLILGGGCAGLSLARELAAFGPAAPTTCIIEQRAQYDDDRTWCFWGGVDALATDLVGHEWPRVQLRAAGESVDFECDRQPYQMIRGGRFYADALQKLSSVPQLRIETAVKNLSEPRFTQSMWQIDTNVGLRRARKLIDTRPGMMPTPPHRSPILWQSFFGKEIVCEAPVFDASRVTLMDFFDDQRGRIIFTYVLPLTPYRALIEVTLFDKSPAGPAALTQSLHQQIHARIGLHPFLVERSEHGILPMGLSRQYPSRQSSPPNYLKVGLMHGGARASTGYAFQRIQRWARTCAAQLVSGVPMQGHAENAPVIRAMDNLFLSLLRHRPETAATLFMAMFKRADPAVLIRFLSDRASMRDALGIISSLPAYPFIRQIGHNLVRAR